MPIPDVHSVGMTSMPHVDPSFYAQPEDVLIRAEGGRVSWVKVHQWIDTRYLSGLTWNLLNEYVDIEDGLWIVSGVESVERTEET